ncbi:hypothetical protein WJX84_010049 [Apatococcus fuscideae]|uniref:ACB domain-containing protein n=1 Tax=Apatococcus fuscideae TaxID=2026836 RepID=A0AAW1TDS9_9CHLO
MAQTAATACTLPYPARFEAAQSFQHSPAAGENLKKDETKLLLYALQQQAKHGPCKDPKPWAWNVVDSAKWSSWAQLGKMSCVEAMRLFVKVIEDEQPDWWALSQSQEAPEMSSRQAAAAADGPEPAAPAANTPARVPLQNGHATVPPASLLEVGIPGEWALVETGGGKRPPPRYEQAVATVGSSMYMVGGNCSGRFLNDVWRLDLDRLAWTLLLPHHPPTPPPAPPTSRSRRQRKVNFKDVDVPAAENGEKEPLKPEPILPPVAGHTLLHWQDRLICIGGHTKAGKGEQTMAVYALDLSSLQWTTLQPSGTAPPARGSHTATLVGDRAFIFGGEDHQRQPHANIAVLHLPSMAWEPAEQDEDDPRPAARSAHTATCIREQWVVVFGGGSAAHCFSDVWALDTQRLRWLELRVAGSSPSPRAGHAAGVLEDVWYMVGGGNNVAGCRDAIALDLRHLPDGDLVWAHVADVEQHGPLACEGLSVQALPSQHALLAWGGYNGHYHNQLHCYKPGVPEQEPSAPSMVTGVAEAAGKVVAAVTEPIKAAAAAIAQPMAAKQNGPTPAESSAQPATKPEIGRSSPFAQVALQQAPPPPQPAAKAAASKPAPKTEQKPMERRTEGALGEVEAARREAATAKEAAGHELALMRRQLASAQSAHAASTKEVEALRAELAAEQAKKFEMEVERSEMHRKLQQTDDLQKELDSYRRMMNEAQAKGKTNGGIWGYISGAT